VPERQFTDAEVEAAIRALSDRERFRQAEQRVARVAPQLQKILAGALQEGGWFDEAHESQVLKAATTPDDEERLTAVRTLLAEETRLSMLVGTAVGYELAHQLLSQNRKDTT
jgi:Lon protease-like protein